MAEVAQSDNQQLTARPILQQRPVVTTESRQIIFKNTRLNTRRKQFIMELLADPKRNASEAAIRAGYSVKCAAATASQLLDEPEVKDEVEYQLQQRFIRLGIRADRVAEEIATCAYSNVLDYVRIEADGTLTPDLRNLTRETAAAIQDFTIDEVEDSTGKKTRKMRFRLVDKLHSLEMLGRHRDIRLFLDRDDGAGKGGQNVFNIAFLDAIVNNTVLVASKESIPAQTPLLKGEVRG